MSDRTASSDSAPAIFTFMAGPFRVTYGDTDRMGHAYHAEYLEWFEQARTELVRSLGRSYRQWEDEDGVFLPVTECSVRFHQAVLYDDLLMVETSIVRLTRASVRFEYRLRREGAGEVLATGSTTHAFIDKDGRIVRVAERLLPQFFS